MRHILEIILGTVGALVVLAAVGWGIFDGLRRQNTQGQTILKLVFTVPFVLGCFWLAQHLGPFGPFVIVLMAVVMSYLWTPGIAAWVVSPLTNMVDGGHEPPERKPFYSIAMTKRNRGKPHEAIEEIRRQLESFPNDFEGIMLLARVQAEDMADLPGAALTVQDFCDWPGAPLQQVAAALTQVADWQLKLAADAEAARDALRQIISRFPNTEAALIAEQRIAHLSDAEKMLGAQNDRQNITLAAGVNNVGLLDSTAFLKPQEIEPGKLAAAHVKHLETHPHDTEVREKLAVLYAHEFKRLDLATMELVQLINEPKHTTKQIAHWLNLLANFQVELGADQLTVRDTLEKIITRFPTLPVADVARRRLARLENEFKGLKSAPTVKLGTYEQNVGLKYGGPRRRE